MLFPHQPGVMGGPVLSCVADQHTHMHRSGNRTLSIIAHATDYYSPSGLSALHLKWIIYYKHLKLKIIYSKLRFSNIDAISNCSDCPFCAIIKQYKALNVSCRVTDNIHQYHPHDYLATKTTIQCTLQYLLSWSRILTCPDMKVLLEARRVSIKHNYVNGNIVP